MPVLVTGLTDEQLTAFELRAEAAMWQALQAVADQVADTIGAIQVASSARVRMHVPAPAGGRLAVLVAADPPPVPDIPGPPGQPYVSPDDLAQITPLWQQQVDRQLMPVVAEVYQLSSGTIHAQLVDAARVPTLPPVSSLAAEQYLAQARNTFANVGNQLWENARTTLLDGFQQGDSIPELAARVRGAAQMTAPTATLVARTQVLDASNSGSIATARASGLALRKGWLDTGPPRTRPSHLEAGARYGSDHQFIPLADQFIVGGYSCDRPHDPSLPPAERSNCRCTLAYSVGAMARQPLREQLVPPIPGQSGAVDQLAADLNARVEEIMQDVRAAADQVRAGVTTVAIRDRVLREAEAVKRRVLEESEAVKQRVLAEAEAIKQDVQRRFAERFPPVPPPRPPFRPPDLTGARGLSDDPATRIVQIGNRIRQAYDTAPKMPAGGVWLADLRNALGESVNRLDFDDAVRALGRERGGSLVPNENQKEFFLTLQGPARQEAAVQVGPVRYHYLILERDALQLRALPEVGRALPGPGPGMAGRAAVPVRDALRTARTRDDLAAATRAEIRQITGREVVVEIPQDASLATMREFYEGVLRGMEQYPDTRLRALTWFGKVDGHYAEADDTAVLINSWWSSLARRPAFVGHVRRDVANWDIGLNGWMPRNTGSIDSTGLHEYGHVVHKSLPDPDGFSRTAVTIMERQAARAGIRPEDFTAGQLGNYSTATAEELVASSFADVLINQQFASPLGREIVDALNVAYRAAGRKPGPAGLPTAARTVSRAVPSRSVTQLRKAITDRGVAVPAGIRGPALRQLAEDLENGMPPAAARARAVVTIIDERRAVADALTEAEELVANGASQRALASVAARLRTTLDADALKTARPLLDAMTTGDQAAIRAAIPNVARAAKLRQVGGNVGAVARLDRSVMGEIGEGRPVTPGVRAKGTAPDDVDIPATPSAGSGNYRVTVGDRHIGTIVVENGRISHLELRGRGANSNVYLSADKDAAFGQVRRAVAAEVNAQDVRAGLTSFQRHTEMASRQIRGHHDTTRAGWIVEPDQVTGTARVTYRGMPTDSPEIGRAALVEYRNALDSAGLRVVVEPDGSLTVSKGAGVGAEADAVRVVRPGWATTFERQNVVLSRAAVVQSETPVPAKAAAKKAAPRKATSPTVTRGNDLISNDGVERYGAWLARRREELGAAGRADVFIAGRAFGIDAVARRQGFDGLPAVVSPAEMDRLIAQGSTPMYRGLARDFGSDDITRTGAFFADEFRRGGAHWAAGTNGSGIYFIETREAAAAYADHADAVLRAVLRSDARVIERREVRAMIEEARQRARAAGVEWPESLSDEGIFAASLGYDAMTARARSGLTTVVLNRTAVIVESGATRATKATAAKAAKKAPAKKVAAPKPPTPPERMSTPALTAELRTRGALEPFDLPSGGTTTLDLANVPKDTLAIWVTRARELRPDQLAEEVGRWRQVIIDRRRVLAEVLSEADELIENLAAGAARISERDAARIVTRLEGRIRRAGASFEAWPDAQTAARIVAAVRGGNIPQLRRALEAAAKKHQLARVGGQAGSTGTFDRATMTAVGDIPDGARVVVVRPGYAMPDGTVIVRPSVQAFDFSSVPRPTPARIRTLVEQETPITVEKLRGGTQSESIELRTYATGERIVVKRYGARGIRDTSFRDTDAEELGARLMEAVGAHPARAVRIDPSTMAMEYVDGTVGTRIVGPGLNTPDAVVNSQAARRMGLADVLMGNQDRNTGNWFLMPDGTVIGIDHGRAWLDDLTAALPLAARQLFGRYLIDEFAVPARLLNQIDLSRSELAAIRRRIQKLQPLFVERGHRQWFDDTMALLAEIQKRASRP